MKGLARAIVFSHAGRQRTPVCEFWRRASWSARVVTGLMSASVSERVRR